MGAEPIISSDFACHRGEAELSSIELAVGVCSPNREMVVGRSGYFFVFEGANNVATQYLKAPVEVEETASAWADLIGNRRERVAAAGAQFLQIVIPEKSSLIPEMAPYPASNGTPLMRRLSNLIAGRQDCIDARLLFEGDKVSSAFGKTDFHLSPEGSARVFCAALTALGLDAPLIEFGEPQVWKSDIPDYFNGLHFYNRMAFPSSPQIYGYGQALTESEVVDVEGHIGTRRVWKNSTAPVKKRVLAFGNSFFERGGSPACLSWWFARWFEDFQFHWSPRLEDADVEAFRPDIVICQTIERFLIEVPVA